MRIFGSFPLLPASSAFAEFCWPTPECLGIFFPTKMELIHLSCRLLALVIVVTCHYLFIDGERKGKRQVIAGIWHTWAFPRPVFLSSFLSVSSQNQGCPVHSTQPQF